MASKKLALIVSAATMVSRVLGMVRDVVLGAMFGAGRMTDAYLAAFQIPNLLRDMFAEGALSQAFTSTFTKEWEKNGERSAWELACIVISTVLWVLGVICAVGILLSYWIVLALNPGFAEDPGKVMLTTRLTQILWPFILFTSLAALAMGILNSRHYFGLPASASAVFNLVSIVLGVSLAYTLDPQPVWWRPDFGPRGIVAVAVGTLVGGLAQLGIQVPKLWKIGFRLKWKIDFQDERFRTVIALMVPTVLAAMAVQVNVLVNNAFVSYVPGGRTWYTYAFRLFQFPVGVFGVAIATVTLPAVARFKAAEDLAGFGRAVEDALRFAFYLTLPASMGLAVMAPQITKLVYQYMNFDPRDAMMTAYALQAFAAGIAGYSGIKVLIPCFIALHQPNTPFRVSCIAVGINFVLATLFFWGFGWGHVGLAATVALVVMINFLQLLYFLGRQVNLGLPAEWLAFFGKMSVAMVGLAAVALGGGWIADQMEDRLSFSVVTLLTVSLAGIVFFAVSWAFGLKESVELLDMVQRRLGVSAPNRMKK